MKILVALGGNAIQQRGGGGTSGEQFAKVVSTCKHLVSLLGDGHDIAITHGNGPQVGDILLAGEMAKDVIPPMPLDVCGAESQGMIGYMIQQSLENELRRGKIDRRVATVLTQTVVDPSDPAFSRPTKPIGPYYTAKQAEQLIRVRGWSMVDDAKKGYRRVVPSPNPSSIAEAEVIRSLFDQGIIVISAGGGGIPVFLDPRTKTLKGVEAVIDKDLAAALVAELLRVDVLLILTDVKGVWLNYGKRDQTFLSRMTLAEGKKYLKEGQFPPGSMGPKVEAALRFVEAGGKMAVISSLELAEAALKGKSGTQVVPS